MNKTYTKTGMNISILERVMKIYYNRGLEDLDIGWGQQFFLEGIAEQPGITPQELTELVHVDKATVTKVIKKLQDLDYIIVKSDENDRRVRHIYPTEYAQKAMARIKLLHEEFYIDITAGLDENMIRDWEEISDKMIYNLTQRVRNKLETPYLER